ncbi:hypothetical protein SBOR_10131 [Sclerotinia borealis F-4128]|uniref:Uncharacterized protein n=1 Tax=Sclerotinia borealis (strain F-4128) TaxID=1432307 RepID=W9BY10_SCLBF|nr:hypothetical protein SBOR_10131 [Sclerotinia borealis F-4128]
MTSFQSAPSSSDNRHPTQPSNLNRPARTPLPSAPTTPRRPPITSSPSDATGSGRSPRTPLPSAPTSSRRPSRTPLPSAPTVSGEPSGAPLPSAPTIHGQPLGAPLQPTPAVPRRFPYGSPRYIRWRVRTRRLRSWGIVPDIKEPTAAEEALKHRCTELSGLRWSQNYIPP